MLFAFLRIESYLTDLNGTDNYNFNVFVKSIEQLVFPETNFEIILSWLRILWRPVVFLDPRD